jgi:microcystin-dependent protein
VVDYSDLHGAIAYTYGGSGDNFNIPDLRGRTVIGAGAGSGLTNRTLGTKAGTETHTLTTDEIPSHSHTLTRRSNPDAGAFDDLNEHQDESSAATTNRADLGPFSTNNTGGGSAHNNMQPYIVLNYFIKY